MRSDKILEVLMEDKKFAARIKELKEREASCSNALKIAATVEQAEKMARDLTAEMIRMVELSKVQEAAFDRRRGEIEDELKARQKAIDEKAAVEQKQREDLRELIKTAQERADYAEHVEASNNKKIKEMQLWDRELSATRVALALKIQKINEAYNG